MYDKLDKALNRNRRPLLEVCADLGIDASSLDLDDLMNVRCVNCGIWGNRFSEMVDDELCTFCDDLDTLRF